MIKIVVLLFLCIIKLTASEIIHIDENSNIIRLDTKRWDPLYYQYKIKDNIPYQYDKKNDRYFFNPLFGVYFLSDYVRNYNITKDEKYLKYSKSLMLELMNKIEKVNFNNLEAYIFYYEPNDYASRLFHKHYSGLTQAYYVEYLSKLYKLTKDEFYNQVAIKIFNSLLIPIEKGGVLFDKNGYTALEETPLYPNQFILNGWLSAIVSLDKANNILENNNIQNLIKKNIDTLNKIIDKYDVEELNNSRYCLTHFFWFKLYKKNYNIKSIKFNYPLEQSLEINSLSSLNEKKSRWEPYIRNINLDLSSDKIIGKNYIQFNAVLTNLGINEIIIEFDEEKKLNINNLNFQVYLGDYDPMTANTINNKWENIDNKFLRIEGNHLIISVEHQNLSKFIEYPTNFKKKFSDGYRNAYHDIHIKWLDYLGKKYNYEKFNFYVKKWLKYRENWKYETPYKELFIQKKIVINNMFLQDKNDEDKQ